MAWDTELEELMPYTVTVRREGARNAYATAAYSDLGSYRCRVSYAPQRILTREGQDVIANGQIWFSGATPVGLQVTDHVVTPDGVEHDLLRVAVYADDEGEYTESAWF